MVILLANASSYTNQNGKKGSLAISIWVSVISLLVLGDTFLPNIDRVVGLTDLKLIRKSIPLQVYRKFTFSIYLDVYKLYLV